MNTAGLFYLLFVIMRVLMWVRMRMFVSMLVVVVRDNGMPSLKKDTLEYVYQVGFVVPYPVPCPLDHPGGNGPKTVDENL